MITSWPWVIKGLQHSRGRFVALGLVTDLSRAISDVGNRASRFLRELKVEVRLRLTETVGDVR